MGDRLAWKLTGGSSTTQHLGEHSDAQNFSLGQLSNDAQDSVPVPRHSTRESGSLAADESRPLLDGTVRDAATHRQRERVGAAVDGIELIGQHVHVVLEHDGLVPCRHHLAVVAPQPRHQPGKHPF